MKKLVVKLDLPDDKAKQKALKTASTLQGIDFISMDMKEKKMTVIGTVDPVSLVSKLRKYWQTNIITVGPAKEPEPPKKEDPPPAKKDEEPKKESEAEDTATAKQDEPPKDEEPKKEEEEEKKPTPEEPKNEEGKEKKKDEEEEKEEEGKKLQGEVVPVLMPLPPQPDPVLEMVRAYRAYHPQMNTYYYAQSMEENPNACVIS